MVIDNSFKENQYNRICLVIGDVILDEYIFGLAERISPEAPVPIVNVNDNKYTLGGAANVTANINALGAKSILIGIIGKDSDGDMLLKTLTDNGIVWSGITSDKRRTIKKTRVIGNGHQLVRLDIEDSVEINSKDEEALITEYKKNIRNADIVVISDYKKGVCTERVCRSVIEIANKYNKHVIVDPKQTDWSRYSGAYLIKPNLKEFISVVGNANDIENSAKKLISRYSIKNILITRSQDGMMLVSNDNLINIKAEAREVYDVSGAGDTVIATIAAFLSSGETLQRIIEISNIAAGIAVRHFGTFAVTLDDLQNEKNEKSENKNILNLDEVLRFANEQHKKRKKIIFTNGCFDILHKGHIFYLKEAKKLGDCLIVGLNSDSSVKKLKGNSRPINNQDDRAFLLAALSFIDAVTIFYEDTPIELIKKIKPDVLVKGGDYCAENVVGREYAKEIKIIPFVKGKSTSKIIKRVCGNQ